MRRVSVEDLAEEYYDEVWRFCGALAGRAAAEDLAQETFLQATRSIGRFRGHASPRTWLFAIARNVWLDELRARERRRRRDDRVAAQARALSAPDPSGELSVVSLLAGLDPDRRAAFALTQLFRLSYEEAARVCECPTGTIRSRVARAREELLAALSAELPSGVEAARDPRRL